MSAHRSHRARLATYAAPRFVALALVALASSCSSGNSASTALQVPHVFDLNVDPANAVKPIDPARTNVLAADQLRGVLEQDLAWHGITLSKVMQAARRGATDVQPWIDQLVSNTADITGAIGLVYGQVAARAFNQQWAQHTQFLVNYAVAVGKGDKAAATDARENLANYTADSGSFFSTATSGALPADAVAQMLSTHVQHMMAMIDADQIGDVTTSVATAVKDGSYLFTIAQTLSTAIAAQFPSVFPGSTDTPLAAYCSIVTQQAGGYLVSSVLTDDAKSPAVTAADRLLTETTKTDVGAVLGRISDLYSSDPTVRASAAKGALAHSNAFAKAQRAS